VMFLRARIGINHNTRMRAMIMIMIPPKKGQMKGKGTCLFLL
jgi:hypothetical protein